MTFDICRPEKKAWWCCKGSCAMDLARLGDVRTANLCCKESIDFLQIYSSRTRVLLGVEEIEQFWLNSNKGTKSDMGIC